MIICDDAHAAENFIPDMWSLHVSRRQHPNLFNRLYALLKGVLSDNAIYRMEGGDAQRGVVVELVSPIAFEDLRPAVIDAVEAFLTEYADLSYPWKLVGRQLSACNLYCTSNAFEFRPILAPTLTHSPYANAVQRVYMSATLGEDGDLERCFGVKKIVRLPAPEGWDKRGTGRRLILFPELSAQEDAVLSAMIMATPRTLILVPSNKLRDVYNDALKEHMTVFVGADTEDNVETFRSHPGPAALILANRYDGIDFPGDECRSLIVDGFPIGAGLQETFLTQRLKAFAITRDRVRTRVTQALGRCTRDESDYSLVLIFGNELVKWFCTSEHIAGMHPELQAEILFGLENSTDRDSAAFVALSKNFLARSQEWDAAEEYIKNERSRILRIPDSGAEALQKAAVLEIDFTYALWNGSYEKAYQCADGVLSLLSGGEEVRAYRCFWQHQAAVAAFFTWKQNGNEVFKHLSIQRLKDASAGTYGIRWLASLAAKLSGESVPTAVAIATDDWFGSIDDLLARLGLIGTKYDRMLAEQSGYIRSTDAKLFHQGLAFLGNMIGARTHQWEGDAKPDGFWNLAFWKAFVFEAKTGQFGPGSISVTTVRQSMTHDKCVLDDKLVPNYTPRNTVIISPRSTIEREAQTHAGNIYFCAHGDLITLFDNAAAALSDLRMIAATTSRDKLPHEALRIYEKHLVAPEQVSALLLRAKLASLPLSGTKPHK